MKSPVMVRKKISHAVIYLVLTLVAVVALFPALFTVANSFFSEAEILKSYGGTEVQFRILPEAATLQGYAEVFLLSPKYLQKFWNSILLSGSIVAGQVIVSCLGGYGFAKFRFPLKNVFFYLLVILMLLPIQVTLVSNYIVLDAIGLIGSYWSVILPGVFATFGVFLMAQIFSGLPNDMLEAAKLDGANQLRILLRVVIPSRKMGVASLVILSFIDNWNMVEQPLVFLKDSSMHPLSIFLSYINSGQLGIAFVCGVLAILPVLLLYLFLKDALVQGIENSNLK